jgi:predicted DNA-binding protein
MTEPLRKMTAFRLPPDSIAKADKLASDIGCTKTEVVVAGINLVAEKVAKAGVRALRRAGK